VEPFSPVPLGDAVLEIAVDQVHGDYVMIGGVDQVNLLQKGTPEEVRAVTEATIKAGKKNGPFIIQSADFLEYNTPLENIDAFVKTALKHAAYD
jgi:uroporphyrinogen-III decarboxylase